MIIIFMIYLGTWVVNICNVYYYCLNVAGRGEGPRETRHRYPGK